nr:hypothetical protein Iba_scaffold58061CG0010 [Ipomoea batatas]GMD05906.1 hypothetical protein Iba_chr06bCG10950 [Ipomoea batatas]GMD09520.1 hypothetical protein Iba_chr06dCG8960 [Ipomoea batatas]GMD31317.1 hypothetical protein Iba_scaffold84471CG0010 [Ipomoea batatas]GME06411.1 hypothetical protein Iba_scaffold4046CG0020 [Ipomoea batatas]
MYPMTVPKSSFPKTKILLRLSSSPTPPPPATADTCCRMPCSAANPRRRTSATVVLHLLPRLTLLPAALLRR